MEGGRWKETLRIQMKRKFCEREKNRRRKETRKHWEYRRRGSCVKGIFLRKKKKKRSNEALRIQTKRKVYEKKDKARSKEAPKMERNSMLCEWKKRRRKKSRSTKEAREEDEVLYENEEAGGVAQLVERRTGTAPTQVRFPGAARDFSPNVNFQCRLIRMLH